jgi:hypothetical protein
MNTPEGYVSLGLVGFTDKGNYLENETYVKNDLVHEDNAIWRCLVDDCIGVNPRTDDKGHWKLWIDSENDASGITVVDKKGVLEEGEKEIDLQDFLDEIADRVMNKLLTKTGLVNNGLATEAGVAALDAAMGKTLLDKIGDTANLPNGEADIVSALVNQNSNLGVIQYGGLENINTVVNTWVQGTNALTLPAGTYIIGAHAILPSGTGNAILAVNGVIAAERLSSIPLCSNAERFCTFCFLSTLSESTTIRIELYCDTALSARACEVSSMRIK